MGIEPIVDRSVSRSPSRINGELHLFFIIILFYFIYYFFLKKKKAKERKKKEISSITRKNIQEKNKKKRKEEKGEGLIYLFSDLILISLIQLISIIYTISDSRQIRLWFSLPLTTRF